MTLQERRCDIGVMKKTLWESRFEKDVVRGRCMKDIVKQSLCERRCRKGRKDDVVGKTL